MTFLAEPTPAIAPSEAKSPYVYQRKRRMALMIEAAERNLAGLYREAARYGMDELLESRSAFSDAWDRAVLSAQIEATVHSMRERGG